jgi:hypothetical protein
VIDIAMIQSGIDESVYCHAISVMITSFIVTAITHREGM